MRTARIGDFPRGWFVGDFSPSLVRTPHAEVAIKHHRAGDKEDWHVHRVGTEVTVVISGRVVMGGQELGPGDAAVVEPGEGVAFSVLEDAVTVVVKAPSVPGDKYGTDGKPC